MALPLTLEGLNGRLRECGCCEHPKCCPPQIQCQSMTAQVQSVGYLKPPDESTVDSSDDGWQFDHKQVKYLRKVLEVAGVSSSDSQDYGDGSDDGRYESHSMSASWKIREVQEYKSAIEGSIGGGAGFGTCIYQPPEYEYRCEYSGGWTEKDHIPYKNPEGNWANFLAVQSVGSLSDISGQHTQGHIKWEEEVEAFDAAHPAYEQEHTQWKTDHDKWIKDFDAWVIGGEVGTEPAEPQLGYDERPAEPLKFYPQCSYKITVVRTTWERVMVSGAYVIRLVDNGSDSEAIDNPYTYEIIRTAGGYPTPWSPAVTVYEEPVTFAEWIEKSDKWITENADFDHAEDSSGSDACPPGIRCEASKRILNYSAIDEGQAVMRQQWFRMRIKLNKCCAWQKIRSEWDKVTYPQEWLEWADYMDHKGESDSDLPEPLEKPEKLVQVWAWEGTPPRCDVDSSGHLLSDDSSIEEIDPFDHEPMWSPWSDIIRYADGDVEGLILNKNYQQKCYEAPPEEMDEVFGTYGKPEDESLTSDAGSV